MCAHTCIRTSFCDIAHNSEFFVKINSWLLKWLLYLTSSRIFLYFICSLLEKHVLFFIFCKHVIIFKRTCSLDVCIFISWLINFYFLTTKGFIDFIFSSACYKRCLMNNKVTCQDRSRITDFYVKFICLASKMTVRVGMQNINMKIPCSCKLMSMF